MFAPERTANWDTSGTNPRGSVGCTRSLRECPIGTIVLMAGEPRRTISLAGESEILTLETMELATQVGASPGEPAGAIHFENHPARYRHWRLELPEDGSGVARLLMQVDEEAALRPGYAP